MQGGSKDGGWGGHQGSGNPGGEAAWGVPINTTISKQGIRWRRSKEWGGSPLHCASWPFSSRESAGSWLAGDGKWEGRDTHHTAMAVPPTFRCCRRAVAALLFFCKWKKREKIISAHSPLNCPSPCSATVHQGAAVLPGRWLHLDIQLVPKPAALKEEAPC